MDGREELPAEPADRPFDPAREPASATVAAIVADVLDQVLCFERYRKLRRRRRRDADQDVFQATVSAVVSDLIHRELSRPGGWVAIPLSKRRLGGAYRARAIAFNSTLPKVLERLAVPEMAFIEVRKGYRSPFGAGRQTVIRRGACLLTRIADKAIELGDLRRDPKVQQDPLVLRANKKGGQRGNRLEVPDSEPARRYRAEMDQVNAWIGAADLSCYSVGEEGDAVTDDERFLRRIFNNGSLEAGGRLFGGFWQRLSKERRLTEVLVNGEPPVALDFGQMAPRIAYALVGASPPAGDLYRVPPFERNRKGIKPVLNALLASDALPKRFPMGTRSGFPKDVSIGDVLTAIRRGHPVLVPLFGTGVCHQIFFLESQVMVATLLRLIDRGVVALPIHDCVLVARSKMEIARTTMLAAFREIVGIEGVVEREGLPTAD